MIALWDAPRATRLPARLDVCHSVARTGASNGPDVLEETGVVRRDIRSSFGSASGKAGGFPFKMVFTLVDAPTEKPVKGLALYAWH